MFSEEVSPDTCWRHNFLESIQRVKLIQNVFNKEGCEAELDSDVVELFSEIQDEFIGEIMHNASIFSQHRKSEEVDVQDVLLYLSMTYNIDPQVLTGDYYYASTATDIPIEQKPLQTQKRSRCRKKEKRMVPANSKSGKKSNKKWKEPIIDKSTPSTPSGLSLKLDFPSPKKKQPNYKFKIARHSSKKLTWSDSPIIKPHRKKCKPQLSAVNSVSIKTCEATDGCKSKINATPAKCKVSSKQVMNSEQQLKSQRHHLFKMPSPESQNREVCGKKHQLNVSGVNDVSAGTTGVTNFELISKLKTTQGTHYERSLKTAPLVLKKSSENETRHSVKMPWPDSQNRKASGKKSNNNIPGVDVASMGAKEALNCKLESKNEKTVPCFKHTLETYPPLSEQESDNEIHSLFKMPCPDSHMKFYGKKHKPGESHVDATPLEISESINSECTSLGDKSTPHYELSLKTACPLLEKNTDSESGDERQTPIKMPWPNSQNMKVYGKKHQPNVSSVNVVSMGTIKARNSELKSKIKKKTRHAHCEPSLKTTPLLLQKSTDSESDDERQSSTKMPWPDSQNMKVYGKKSNNNVSGVNVVSMGANEASNSKLKSKNEKTVPSFKHTLKTLPALSEQETESESDNELHALFKMPCSDSHVRKFYRKKHKPEEPYVDVPLEIPESITSECTSLSDNTPNYELALKTIFNLLEKNIDSQSEDEGQTPIKKPWPDSQNMKVYGKKHQPNVSGGNVVPAGTTEAKNSELKSKIKKTRRALSEPSSKTVPLLLRKSTDSESENEIHPSVKMPGLNSPVMKVYGENSKPKLTVTNTGLMETPKLKSKFKSKSTSHRLEGTDHKLRDGRPSSTKIPSPNSKVFEAHGKKARSKSSDVNVASIKDLDAARKGLATTLLRIVKKE